MMIMAGISRRHHTTTAFAKLSKVLGKCLLSYDHYISLPEQNIYWELYGYGACVRYASAVT